MAERARPTYFELRDYLWDRCAATQSAVRAVEAKQLESGRSLDFLSTYAYMTEAFMSPVLVKAVQEGDDATQQLGFDIVEELLGSNDELLLGCTYIRVVARISESAELLDATMRLAGPLLRDALWLTTDDPIWQTIG